METHPIEEVAAMFQTFYQVNFLHFSEIVFFSGIDLHKVLFIHKLRALPWANRSKQLRIGYVPLLIYWKLSKLIITIPL